MEKDLTLIKTCIGLVEEETFNGLFEKGKEIAFETGLPLKESVEILLKLASKSIDGWFDIGWGVVYFKFNTNFDFFVVNKWYDSTEIACLFNDNYNVVYIIENQKFYKEYSANEYGDELIKEEIELWKNIYLKWMNIY